MNHLNEVADALRQNSKYIIEFIFENFRLILIYGETNSSSTMYFTIL